MSPADFSFLAGWLKARSGLVLQDDKSYLLESRLGPVARKAGLGSVEALAARLRGRPDPAFSAAVIAAMTTNESLFFRDRHPFDALARTMLPALLGARAAERRLRIWCAAAATGQEPYSVAMTLRERAPELRNWQVEILATDINADVLDRARQGLYTQFEVQRGLPIQLLLRYFERRGEHWQISPALRDAVTFRPFNLLDSFAGLGRFDIVFCRNVLIYFDERTKADVLDRLAHVLPPDGFLALGAAETILGLTSAFEPVAASSGLYRPAARPAKPARSRPSVAVAG